MKYFYKNIKAILFCLIFTVTYGQQNLVLNPSFEDVNEDELSCTFYQGVTDFENAISNWILPTLGSTDIYHMSLDTDCFAHPLSTSPLSMGNQLPRTGDSMIGLYMFSNNSYREYIQGELSESMIAGITYSIKFYVSLAENSKLAANNFGIKFFTEQYFEDTYVNINVAPDANYTNIITDTENWTLVELEFEPQISGLTYFVIGNFFNDENTDYQEVNSQSLIDPAYYFIDDVSITIANPVFEQIEPYCQGALFTLPNISENGYSGTWSPEINNQETTTYTFTPDDSEIEPVTMTVEIIEPYIEPEFNINTIICEGTSFTLPTVSENGFSGIWSPTFNNQATTTYTFTPEEGHCVLPTSVTIEITERIKPEFTFERSVCSGSEFILPLVSDNGIAGTWSPAINNTQTTSYTFTPEETYCANLVSIAVEVIPSKNIILETYCFKGHLYIGAILVDVSSQSTLQWTINDVEVTEKSHQLKVSENANLFNQHVNIVELIITDENGCISTNTIEIGSIEVPCFIPKGISPNGDGLNDYLDLENFGGVSLQIFNRYGTVVYKENNYTNQWDGRSKSGKKLPDGTYFYYIITAKGEQMTGWIQLNR